MKKHAVLYILVIALLSCASTSNKKDPAPFQKPRELSPDLELISLGWGLDDLGYGGMSVPVAKGVVHNKSQKTFARVELDVTYYNSSGTVVESTTVRTTGLGPGQSWKFSDLPAPSSGDARSFELTKLRWDEQK